MIREVARIVTRSPLMESVLHVAEVVARKATPVLITGESGTGKELLARHIHENSPRHQRPFVTVNCAALPRDLIESELFGHERGAFTGAVARRLGRFERAQYGTLLLDEIGELPLDLQAKLLRVLQEKEIERVGGMATIPVDVRIIAATNRDLAAMVDAGDFRDDLFYRLSVIPLRMPALRERPDDIPLLARYFVDKYADTPTSPTLGPLVLTRLIAHAWPGNVRELENVIHRAALLCEGEAITLENLGLDQIEPVVPTSSLVGRTWADVERQLIIDTVEACGGSYMRAAKMLGISRRTIYTRMTEYRAKESA